jgi:glucose 1-dehydrogenase
MDRRRLLLLAVALLASLPHAYVSALAGHRVLVTGASGGLGAGIAKKLGGLGAHVIAHYHTRYDGALATQAAINAAPGRGSCDGVVQCDFRDRGAIDRLWRDVDAIWPDRRLDVLVNNAGVVAKVAAEDDAELRIWDECLQINLHAPLQLSLEARRRMVAASPPSGRGCVVMVSSIHGSSSVEWMTAYAASKAALDRLTAGLSSEWAPDGVRVVGVAPGVVPVERTRDALGTPDAQALWLPHLPVGRMGLVDDVADAVAYVCGAEWLTGSVLTVDGGMTARANMPRRPRPPPPPPSQGEATA